MQGKCNDYVRYTQTVPQENSTCLIAYPEEPQEALSVETNATYLFDTPLVLSYSKIYAFGEFEYTPCKEVEVKFIIVIVFVSAGILCIIALVIALWCARKYRRLYMQLPEEKEAMKRESNEYNLDVEHNSPQVNK